MPRLLNNDESQSIELSEGDLLDIDGSDDPTQAFSARKLLRLAAPLRNKRNPSFRPVEVDEHPTTIFKADDDARVTIPVGMRVPSVKAPFTPPAAAAPIPGSFAPRSPTISPAPPVKSRRNATSSYPPIAISLGSPRERPLDAMMSFVSERPSRAGYITAAVLGALILIGGSIKVTTPKAAAAAPPPVVVEAPPPPAPVVVPAEPEAPQVVTFGDKEGVSIRAKAEPAKPEPKKAPAAAAKAKPLTKLPDGSLALNAKDAKEHDTAKADAKADKKLKSIEQELLDAQLKAAAR